MLWGPHITEATYDTYDNSGYFQPSEETWEGGGSQACYAQHSCHSLLHSASHPPLMQAWPPQRTLNTQCPEHEAE